MLIKHLYKKPQAIIAAINNNHQDDLVITLQFEIFHVTTVKVLL